MGSVGGSTFRLLTDAVAAMSDPLEALAALVGAQPILPQS
jgi:hypothetical protein